MPAKKKGHLKLVEYSEEGGIPQEEMSEEGGIPQEEMSEEGGIPQEETVDTEKHFDPIDAVRKALKGMGLSDESVELEIKKAQIIVEKGHKRNVDGATRRAERAKAEEERKVNHAKYQGVLNELRGEIELSLAKSVEFSREMVLGVLSESETGVALFAGKIEKSENGEVRVSLTSLSPAYRKREKEARRERSGSIVGTKRENVFIALDGTENGWNAYFQSSSSEAAVRLLGIEKGVAPHQSARDLLEKRLKKYIPSGCHVTVLYDKPGDERHELTKEDFIAMIGEAALQYIANVKKR